MCDGGSKAELSLKKIVCFGLMIEMQIRSMERDLFSFDCDALHIVAFRCYGGCIEERPSTEGSIE